MNLKFGSDTTFSFIETIETMRRRVSNRLNPSERSARGQFFTPSHIGLLMANMFKAQRSVLRVLDPGAGIGSLTAALIAALCERTKRPRRIILTAYENDSQLIPVLNETMELCRAQAKSMGIEFEYSVIDQDFLETASGMVRGDLFENYSMSLFDCVIMNPPYKKIQSVSRERKLLRNAGIETSNLYTGFIALATYLLEPDGEIVAITPRSFCNGPYFESFRKFLFQHLSFRHIHVFERRDKVFADDSVLQENIIFHAVKSETKTTVTISSSVGPESKSIVAREIPYSDLVHRNDPHMFIHIVPDVDGDHTKTRMKRLCVTLQGLGLSVSTGRVVDFRSRDILRELPGKYTAPLIYPCHFQNGFIEWPNGSTKKPNALAIDDRADDLLIPAGHYVLVKRFSAKEERRRIVAAVYDAQRLSADRVAFENHLNYFHEKGKGLPITLAKGLTAFLSSTIVDSYFRHFSGHTQVNAADLRSLRYPSRNELLALGRRIGHAFPSQSELDDMLEEIVFHG